MEPSFWTPLFRIVDYTILGFALFAITAAATPAKRAIQSSLLDASPHSDNSSQKFLPELLESALLAIRFVAILFLVLWVFFVITSIQENSDFAKRLTGDYAVYFWMSPLTIGLLPQLFWIKRIRKTKWVIIIISILILFRLYIEKIVIITTSFHRDHGVSYSWILRVIEDFGLGLILFSIPLAIAHLARRKLFKA